MKVGEVKYLALLDQLGDCWTNGWWNHLVAVVWSIELLDKK